MWPDCPVRDCVIEKSLDFCYQCTGFPCKRLREEPLLDHKQGIVETNMKMKDTGIEEHAEMLKGEYKRLAASRRFNKQAHT